MWKLDEINNLPGSHRLGENSSSGIRIWYTNFSLLKFTPCTTFPRLLLTFGISFYNLKIISCV